MEINEIFANNSYILIPTILQIAVIYYLLKNKEILKHTLHYKLFLTGTILYALRNLYSLYAMNNYMMGMDTFISSKLYFIAQTFLLPMGFYLVLYGIISLLIEKSTKKLQEISMIKMFLLVLFSFGTYIPIWLIQKYKEYDIDKKYHWYLIVYIYLLGLYYDQYDVLFKALLEVDVMIDVNPAIVVYGSFFLYAFWTLFMLFFLQKQIEEKSRIIKFDNWLFTLMFGFFYIQYHINQDVKFKKSLENTTKEDIQ